MIFKRRIPKSLWQKTKDCFYPRIGWQRTINYISHRVKRLPDTPDRIARGIGAGVCVTFTPFFGFHFMMSAFLALFIRGNIIAALLATFFGNPITFPFIALISYRLGIFMLDIPHDDMGWQQISQGTTQAFLILWVNLKALFGGTPVPWQEFNAVIKTIFLPYVIGGILLGILVGFMCYIFSKPLISAYQNRRKGRIMAKIKRLHTTATTRKKNDSDVQ